MALQIGDIIIDEFNGIYEVVAAESGDICEGGGEQCVKPRIALAGHANTPATDASVLAFCDDCTGGSMEHADTPDKIYRRVK